MIHYLVKEELPLVDDGREFNSVRFMDKYGLKTTVNLTILIVEYESFASKKILLQQWLDK